MTANPEEHAAHATVGALLKRARLAAGLTQAQLAAGISSVGYVSLLESDQRLARREVIEAFARRLGIDPQDLGATGDEAHAEYCLNAATVAISQGAFDAARALLQECRNCAPADSPKLADADLLIFEVELRAGDGGFDVASAALAALNRLSAAAQQTKLRLIITILRRLHDDGDLALACEIAQQWLARARDEGWPEEALVELLCMTATCLAQRGDFTIARRLTQEALHVAEQLGAPRALVHANWELGWIEHQRGNYKRARQYSERALRLCEAAELTDMLPRVQLAAVSVLLDMPEPDLAALATLSEKALLAATLKDDRAAIAYALVARSRAALLAGLNNEAIELAQRGRSIPEATPNSKVDLALTQMQAQLANGVGVSWPDFSLLEDLASLEDAGNLRAVARFWAEMAVILEGAGDSSGALQAYRKAMLSARVLPETTGRASAVPAAETPH